jgi:chemotaxis-related protein WspB
MLVLLFQVGGERLALDVRRIKEVVPHVPLQALAGGPPWLNGAFVYRGQVVPVVDLHRLTGRGECPPQLSSRIILVPQPGGEEGRLLGLLASQVADLRELEVDEQTLTQVETSDGPSLGAVLADREGLLRLLDVDRLLPGSLRGSLQALTPRTRP